jgi:iron complex transport system substrate-binding protein
MRTPVHIVFIALAILVGCKTEKHPETVASATQKYSKGFELISLNQCECLRLYDLESSNLAIRATFCHQDPKLANVEITLLPDPKTTALRIATVSTTHISLFAAIHQLQTITGTAFADRIINADARALIEAGKITDLSGEKDIDTEKTLAVAPHIITSYPYGNNQYEGLQKAGCIVIPFSEYLETHPLGRAEWLIAVGFITGQIAEATAVFQAIEKRYLDLAMQIEALPEAKQPVVFTGSHANGTWYAPSGNSFMGVFTADAGAAYLFSDRREQGNISLDFEELIVRAMTADYWGKVIYTPGELTLAELRADDVRYAELPAFKKGQVFYCNAAETDYFGDAIVQPEVILADLIHIFHPEQLPHHEARYFKRINL